MQVDIIYSPKLPSREKTLVSTLSYQQLQADTKNELLHANRSGNKALRSHPMI